MPSKRREAFAAISTETPIRTINLNMFEVSEQYHRTINEVLTIIDEDTKAITEIPTKFFETKMGKLPERVEVIEIFRSTPDTFTVKNRRTNKETHYAPNLFLKWLYEKAPFMPMVGRENN